jgi:serine/threonine protein kinase
LGEVIVNGDFRIGNWLVQPLRDVVESPETSIPLEPKAMDLLVYLAQHQGDVIPKERLIQAVWPDAFVTDEVLTNNIWKLRQAFGDEPKNPKVIQTVPRRGYQLIAEVVWEEVSDEPVSRYEVAEKIGQGAMGEVYLAEDTVLRRKVALKFVREKMDQEGTWHRRLVREARSAAALDHPFICKVYDTGQLDGRIFIAMEYVKGQSLKDLLKGEPLSLEMALRIVKEAAEALETAHASGLVHRDIKPSNFMLTEQGHVKLMDFGVAKRLRSAMGDGQDWTGTLTSEASTLGTVPYMSPEQVRGQDVDPRSDIFSLGVVFYEMVAGVHPFRRGLSADTAAAVLNEAPSPLSRFRKGLPAGLQVLLNRMLAKDRETRYQSLSEVRRDLSKSAVSGPAVLEWGAPWSSRRRLVFAGTAAIAVALVAVLAVWSPWDAPVSEPMSRPSPLTSYPGTEMMPAISPDGNFVAYSRTEGEQGNFDIYAQVIGTSEPQRKTDDPADDLYPTWSPDGSRIAFLRKFSDREYSVFVIPILGGSPLRVADLEPGYFWGFDQKRISWSPNDQILAIAVGGPGGEPDRIALLSLETREMGDLAASPEDAWIGCPVFSPDGETVAFVQYTPDDCRLCFQYIGGGDPNCQSPFPSFIWDMDWTPDGEAIVYTAGLGPDRRLWEVAVGGGEPQLLPFGEDAKAVSISRRGGRLVYQILQQDMSLWQASVPTASQALAPVTLAPVKFPASSTRNDRFPEYSPDGEKVLFESSRMGPDYQLWVSQSDGARARKLTSVAMTGLGGRWSPTGDRIVFCAWLEDREIGDVFVVDADGGQPVNLTSDQFSDGQPSWSADSQWIYYESEREGGIVQVFRVPAAGGEPEQLTKRLGKFPREVNEDLLLFWRGERIWGLSLDTREETLLLDAEIGQTQWTTWQGRLVYSDQQEDEGVVIRTLDLVTGETLGLLPLDKGTTVGTGLTVSPDGQSILFSQTKVNRADLMIVENFY